MTRDLYVDMGELETILKPHSIVLLVNYFGFRDRRIGEIITMAHRKDCVVIEDNAHGFFTYFCKGKTDADAAFFSLHKMFPFNEGGGLLVSNGEVDGLVGVNELQGCNPFEYDYNGIANRRVQNYRVLLSLLEGKEDYFIPLRIENDLENNIPQTLPIVIKKGDRNRIYENMNAQGFGAVSLYHTMIEELQNGNHKDALWLSQRILNLPVHQDCDTGRYNELVDALVKACKET